ncbi:hypothetical protein CRN61_11060 [Vibrio vulnificus]|nr:hypothetical protein SC81_16085 [Vibrio vulnificus]POC13607.1 hypothetical protein CRN54_02100 [Vibrio vulnificus]POC79299.1 hypothetical protein CRN61_11060 [Vibrio vulnificus]HAS8399906.1 hypothetical protein [Vibrio vulnificus]HAS8491762.1 hypothetical protein [Vibrio vulnificus]
MLIKLSPTSKQPVPQLLHLAYQSDGFYLLLDEWPFFPHIGLVELGAGVLPYTVNNSKLKQRCELKHERQLLNIQ